MRVDYDKDQLAYALANALKERDEAREQAAMWKANHDNQVSLKAMLMDRPDLGDRASRIAELIRERDEARERERVAILSFDEERQRALREGERVLEARRERDEAREKYDKLATEHMLVVNKLCEERDEAREEIEALRHEYHGAKAMAGGFKDKIKSLREQRDEAREQIKELIYIAERAIALAEIDFQNDKFGVVSELRSDLAKIKKSK